MKIRINSDIIKALYPCKDRLENWMMNYPSFDGDIQKFLTLSHINHSDKLWVALRLMPQFLVEVFAIDCAFEASHNFNDTYTAAHAAAHATATTASDAASDAATYPTAAAYAATYAAYAATYTATYATTTYTTTATIHEQSRQLDALQYLIRTTKRRELV